MGTQIDDDPLFTTLLQSGGEGCNSTPTQPSNVVLQATFNDGEKRQPPKKVQRGASFTAEEDNLLVSAWLNISIDAIKGTDQKSTQMWERISVFYHEYKKQNNVNRSVVSLMNQWSSIQKCTNKFCAFLAQVESLHPSGATEQDKIEKAKIMYKEIEKSNFTMEHCWCLLRHQQKWQQHISTLGTRRRPQGEAALDTVEENIEVFAERPLGKKTEKEMERKRKSMEGKESEISISLAKMTEDRATTMEERRNAQLKADEKSLYLSLTQF
ncbi:glutathione S-transferase T3-like [Juglans regia]|uniref:Glutathione S-transferase T3-like n=1 Tax=Juglans regia TaxID=51240 RepID=A0A6P9EHN7_JUGRE|nr:glutathione S-transferase T3-like [Juglans regia]